MEDNIECPYCGWEDTDSWEFGEESGTYTCQDCNEDFDVVVDVRVSYTTSKKSCKEHDYVLESLFTSRRKYKKGSWVDLPEEEHKHYKVMKCAICDHKDYVKISKEYYESK